MYILHLVSNPPTPGIHFVDKHRRVLIRCGLRSSKLPQQAQHLGKARTQRVLRSNGPQQVFHDAEHDEPKEDADQTITDYGGAECRAKALEDGFVKGKTNLITAIGNAWTAEVRPGSNRSACTKD